MFRRKQEPPVISNLAYARYLRAQWKGEPANFLRLSEDQQEALAVLGDTYLLETQALLTQANEGEKDEAGKQVGEAVQSILANIGGRAEEPPPMSFAGFGKRNGKRRFMGQEADTPIEGSGTE